MNKESYFRWGMTRAAASAPATILMVILLISDTSGVSAVSLKERHEVVDTVGVGNGPGGVAVNPITNRIYVVNYLRISLSTSV